MTETKKIIITHGRLVTPDQILVDELILIRDGKIIQVGGRFEPSKSDTVLDAKGRLVTPGFLDYHLQGAGGADVFDGTPEALHTIARTCARYGVTGFLATTLYFPDEDNSHVINAADNTGPIPEGAELLGIYLESPFISPQKLGMIPVKAAHVPSEKMLDQILEVTGGKLRIMVTAPELDGIEGIISLLSGSGIVCSFGHSSATYEQTVQGFKYGLRYVTHLFNAMPSMHHRDPGPFPAIVEAENVVAEIICDGAHIHPAMVKFAVDNLGNDRFSLITDGMMAIGKPDGTYEYGKKGLRFTTKDGIARYTDGTLMGTATSINTLLKRCLEFTGLPVPAAVRAASLTPAKVLGIDKKKGSLEEGKDADVVILNDDFSVWKTIIGGEVVWDEESRLEK